MSRGRRIRRTTEPTTTSNLSGLWTLNEISDFISENKWPRGPVAPTSLVAAAGDAQLTLSWTAPATPHGTITNYLVEYTPSGGSAVTVLTGSTSTSYTLTGLTNGTSYSARVAAVNFTAGDWSGTATGMPNPGITAEYLVVAGGGSGGRAEAGGGGAGGLLTGTSVLTPGTTYTVAIGKGGGAIGVGVFASGNSGKDSSFHSFVAVGGGGGGGNFSNGLAGGSGGGGGRYAPAGFNGGGSRTLGQGNVGGGAWDERPGGGGGSGSAGSRGGSFEAGNGGDGTPISITGTSVVYAAGGGGGIAGRAGAGGSSGVGGRGGQWGGPAPTSGAANTGSGGGGANGDEDGNWDYPSGAGAGGVVVVAVPGNVSATVTGFTLGTTYTRDASTRNGYTVFRFIYGGSSDQLTGTITF